MKTTNGKGAETALVLKPGRQEPRAGRFHDFVSSVAVDEEKRGNVILRIIKNETHSADVIYNVELVRSFLMGRGLGEAFNFLEPDLSHAIHCLKWSQNWFWREERGLLRNRVNSVRPIHGRGAAWRGCPEQFETRGDHLREFVAGEQVSGEKFGSVAARIFENETHAGEIIHKVQLVRIYTMGRRCGDAFNFPRPDITDAIQAIKWSQNWFRYQDRERFAMFSRRWF